ncbi:MAG: cysteine rich repeat-containing protein [Alphaproteobacteria bacterium]
MKIARLLLAAALLAGSLPAVAQDRQDARRACGGDFRRLCPGVQPGGGRVLACLKANEPSLTPACRAVVQSAKAPG